MCKKSLNFDDLVDSADDLFTKYELLCPQDLDLKKFAFCLVRFLHLLLISQKKKKIKNRYSWPGKIY